LRWLFHLSSSPPYGILLRATSSSAVRTNSMWTGCNSRSRSTTFITACVDEVENHIIWNEKCIRNHKKHINTLTVPLIYWTSETTRCNVSSPYINRLPRTHARRMRMRNKERHRSKSTAAFWDWRHYLGNTSSSESDVSSPRGNAGFPAIPTASQRAPTFNVAIAVICLLSRGRLHSSFDHDTGKKCCRGSKM
jgi:hypothetical protein